MRSTMQIGLVEIHPNDHWEVKGKNLIWVWHNEKILVVYSNSALMRRLIREFQESNRTEEEYENGTGI